MAALQGKDYTTDAQNRRVYTNEDSARGYYSDYLKKEGSFDQNRLDQFVNQSMQGWGAGAPGATGTPPAGAAPGPQAPAGAQGPQASAGPAPIDYMGSGDTNTFKESPWAAGTGAGNTSLTGGGPMQTNAQQLAAFYRR